MGFVLVVVMVVRGNLHTGVQRYGRWHHVVAIRFAHRLLARAQLQMRHVRTTTAAAVVATGAAANHQGCVRTDGLLLLMLIESAGALPLNARCCDGRRSGRLCCRLLERRRRRRRRRSGCDDDRRRRSCDRRLGQRLTESALRCRRSGGYALHNCRTCAVAVDQRRRGAGVQRQTDGGRRRRCETSSCRHTRMRFGSRLGCDGGGVDIVVVIGQINGGRFGGLVKNGVSSSQALCNSVQLIGY